MTKYASLFFLTASAIWGQGWTDLGGTRLSSVCPPNNYRGINYAFADHCSAVMQAWSGAALDTKRNRLIIWGGGHGDYSGNEVYSLNLGVAPPTMTRLTEPSDFTQNPAGCPDTNTVDGTPVSRHTYNSLVYLPTVDRVLSFGGALAPCGGPFSRKTYTLDLSVSPPVWHAMDPVNGYDPTSDGIAVPDGNICAYNPTDQMVYCIQGGNYILQRYDYSTNTWTKLTPYASTVVGNATTAVIDPIRQLMVFIGNASGTGVLKLQTISLAAGSGYAVTDLSSSVTGCSALGVNYPGVTYDTARGVIAAYPNTGNTVYLFDPDTRVCTPHTFSGGPPAATVSGTFGRFQYVPGLGKYVLATATVNDAFSFTIDATPANGIGSSSVFCLDRDGDGHGTGPGCSGRDADDLDATVFSSAQMLAKWSTLSAFLTHLGYSPSRIWYMSTTGNDGSCVTGGAPAGIASPCLTFSRIYPNLLAGDAVIYRAGTYLEPGRITPPINGTSGHPLLFMAYPGEAVTIDTTASSSSNIDIVDRSYVILDGFKLTRGLNNGCISGGTSSKTVVPPTFHNIVVRHIEANNCIWGFIAAGLQYVTVEDAVMHDNLLNGGQHGIYIGARSNNLSSDIIIQRVISYNNGYTGIQVNGNVSNLVEDQNISFGNLIADYSWENGVHNSFFRSNVAFNWGGSGGLVISEYDALEGIALCGPDGASVCVCAPIPNEGSTCAHDQTGNLIENFTAYGTSKASDGTDVAGVPAIAVALQNRRYSCTTPTCQNANLGNNTFRNIIAVTYGIGNHYPPIIFNDNDRPYLSTSTFKNIVVKQTDASNGNAAIGFGLNMASYGFNAYSCAAAAALTTISNCVNADPMFRAASPANFNSPGSFDFHLDSGSPAIRAGTSLGVPRFDLVGQAFAQMPPSIGAYESLTPAARGACDLNGDSTVNIADVQMAINQALGQTACSNGDLQPDGQCNVLDVQRVVTAALGGPCTTGP